MAQGLRKLLEFDGNVEETFMQNFQISYEAYGMVQTHDLKEGGADIPLTNDNRQGTRSRRTFLHTFLHSYSWSISKGVCSFHNSCMCK